MDAKKTKNKKNIKKSKEHKNYLTGLTNLVLRFLNHGLGSLYIMQALLVVQYALLHGSAVQLARLAFPTAATWPCP